VRVLIVDDELLARQRVRRLLQAEGDVEVVGEATDGHEAVALIRSLAPDLVCLDVQMPGLDGFGVLRALDGGPVPLVLFITALDDQAQRAFDVHAVDYVLKPVEPERFRQAFARARQHQVQAAASQRLGALLESARRLAETPPASDGLSPQAPLRPATQVLAAAQPTSAYTARLLVRQDGRMLFLKVADIDWAEADRNYVRLHAGETVHIIRERISVLGDSLDPRLFARIHRSTVVNLTRVRELQPWFSGDAIVILHDGTRLRLSRHYRDRVERVATG
jgi:two-component system LytT family response regulator